MAFSTVSPVIETRILKDPLATIMGFINFLANLGAILVVTLLDWLRETTGSFVWAFLILSLFALFAAALGEGGLWRFQDLSLVE